MKERPILFSHKVHLITHLLPVCYFDGHDKPSLLCAIVGPAALNFKQEA